MQRAAVACRLLYSVTTQDCIYYFVCPTVHVQAELQLNLSGQSTTANYSRIQENVQPLCAVVTVVLSIGYLYHVYSVLGLPTATVQEKALVELLLSMHRLSSAGQLTLHSRYLTSM